jgi:hypothetical protein
MKTQCDNVCWLRATNECDRMISVSASAEAALHAFAGGGAALTPGHMAATHRGTQGRPRWPFGLWNLGPRRRHIEQQRYTRTHFGYTSYHAVYITNEASDISDYCTTPGSARGVVRERHAAPKRVPRAEQKSCFGSLKCGSWIIQTLPNAL